MKTLWGIVALTCGVAVLVFWNVEQHGKIKKLTEALELLTIAQENDRGRMDGISALQNDMYTAQTEMVLSASNLTQGVHGLTNAVKANQDGLMGLGIDVGNLIKSDHVTQKMLTEVSRYYHLQQGSKEYIDKKFQNVWTVMEQRGKLRNADRQELLQQQERFKREIYTFLKENIY